MEIIQTRTKKWGNSIGMVLPKEIVVRNNIRENQPLKLAILNEEGNVVERSFGKLKGKLKISSQKMKDNLREDETDTVL
ncbi:AbrB/MazE/SpoVT family DNA-binding domain-containing protein [Candidatus Pacearchaeota archaeon]|nr:AbrB/MazE/SpoVT family DNA-binding domain-containing protein [Candidatus Pacearchaeota archaeon]